MAYDVRVFSVVEITLTGIDAVTPVEAIAQAKENVDFFSLLGQNNFDWAEDHAYYLVGATGDRDRKEAEWFIDADHVEMVQEMLQDKIHQA